MTFDTAAWAIDGPLLSSALARRAEYAAVGGAQGIVNRDDLKVTQLGVPGQGLLIAAGVGLVTNGYQTSPNETYVVSNPSVHTIGSSEMPAANPSAKSYIIAIVVGDPDFSQSGHPWMGAGDPPPGSETTFNYVRPTIIPVASSSVVGLSVNYPALAIARIDIPANTTTITNAMITDLRKLARPRQEQQIFVSPSGTWTDAAPSRIASGSTYADWGAAYTPTVKVPTWAKRAIVVSSINGARLADTSAGVVGKVRTQLGTVSGAATSFDFPTGTGAVRDNLQTASEYDVLAIAGSNVALRVEGYQNGPSSPTTNQRLSLQSGSQQIFDVRFFEE